MKTRRQTRALLHTVFFDPFVVVCPTKGAQVVPMNKVFCTCKDWSFYKGTRPAGTVKHKAYRYFQGPYCVS